MNVLFLDIDGVLATDDCYRKKKFKIDTFVNMPYPWNEEAANSLARIIKETNCKIVISSDWRIHFNTNEISAMFKYYNLPYENDVIIGMTANDSKFFENQWDARVRQIEQYVATYLKPEDKWLVVDDMLLWENNDKFVKINDTDIGISSVESIIIEKFKN